MSSQMSNAQRAMQFWSVLVMAARTQQVLSYETLADMTGIPRFGMKWILGIIFDYCRQKGLPPLTSIVLEQSTGRPADEYFNRPPFDLAAEHRRVFIFDWLKDSIRPTVESFEQVDAAKEEPVNA